MEKGAFIERGIILTAQIGKYTVKSLDRDGIVTPPIEATDNNISFQVGDTVCFFLFRDGTGKILCPAQAGVA